MCGISAIFALQDGAENRSGQTPHDQLAAPGNNHSREQLEQQMQASLKQIKHRGPDHSGVWISEDSKAVLGHSRLAINDLSSSGNQPFHSPDGSVHAVVNGELYDFEELKRNLLDTTGYHFTSNSDSEVVVALYQAYGRDFVQHLRGEFAICLYDESNDLFIAARDRYGIKPLFWTVSKQRLLVGAEIKAFIPLDWQAEWDVKSIIEAGWNFDDRTLFKGVKKVRPGYYLTCDSFGTIKHHQYWDMEFPEKTVPDPRSEQELIQSVRDRLVEAVRIRLRADVPVGVYLSGGIDSSVIAGIVTHLVKEQSLTMGSLPPTDRVSCFSVAFEKSSGFDESDVAERSSEFLGVKQYKQIMDEEAFASRFEEATWHCEHHVPDLNYIGKFALSELPQKHGFKVVLTGEGADETMTGYGVYLPDVVREPDLTWPGAMPEDERKRVFATSEEQTKEYYRSIGAEFRMSEGQRKLNNISTLASMAAFIPDVFDPSTAALHAQDPQNVIANDVSSPVLEKMQEKWHPINTALYVWTKGHLPNQFMSALGDRTEMAHSIEGRTPFLDHHLTEYVNTIPPSLKMRWKGGDEFTSKWILREACKEFVTPEIYERAKHPYSAPTSYETDGPLHKLLGTLITEENVRQLGFVSWDVASTLLERAFVQKEALAARLAFVVAQWVVLARRFGIKTAKI
ncbi:uncharacterized protein LTR77_006529 [Saxophila tyrrhenica]|uniref:Glutamine amidotransferase type-2 domain-containing protein n=1 Tax=Saxophila tyrrhenica TaxID=1690608 RepID=A0AAV9P546_9PEZI|nr:hypothetical protein LTR77_006529 [Saxophila tyrrhenica]